MDYVTLGRSGLKVSRACLGAMNFGTRDGDPTNEADARTIIDAFLDGGNNFIDTANWYTGGTSEEIVGRAVKGKRDKVVVATKGYGPIGDGPNERGLSRGYLTRALDESLKRLGADYIDLYQCHRPDPDTPIEETMDTLAGFVRAGKVRYIGCSEFSGSQIVEAQWAAEKIRGVPFTSDQPQYSLIAREIEADILPACGRHGLGTLIWSPLGGGVLTGKYKEGEAPGADTRFGRSGGRAYSARLTDRNFAIVQELEAVAKELDSTPTAVAIAWCLTRQNITSVIIGPRTLEQFQQNMVGFELQLPAEAAKRLSDVSKPGVDPRLPAQRRAA